VQFTRNADGNYRVAGDLVFATVRDLLTESAPIFIAESKLSIDLSAVSSADSAGLALLIEWYRMASRAKKPVKFVAVPAQLHALAKISEIDGLLPFE
jgi:phospholipid transport system transporter-binding protein